MDIFQFAKEVFFFPTNRKILVIPFFYCGKKKLPWNKSTLWQAILKIDGQGKERPSLRE